MAGPGDRQTVPPPHAKPNGNGRRSAAAAATPGATTWDPARCNWRGSALNRPNPVGVYTQGATKDGLQELGGNVYEWTTSLYRPYPYAAGDGRERTDVEGLRVARGGSWYTDKDTVRCAYRYGLNPGDWSNFRGFRLARILSS